ncbi:hypothetical protein EVAR_92879_1 [Eumeta japonica]|uniref:Uncharacterized protein n=1 Tax=Eumeta variegata TaxID=151549 RepID=A0A4C1TB09_EUMVA|nr:hypothetical protein EVAR_92879_1 [Eumeta japonica]
MLWKTKQRPPNPESRKSAKINKAKTPRPPRCSRNTETSTRPAALRSLSPRSGLRKRSKQSNRLLRNSRTLENVKRSTIHKHTRKPTDGTGQAGAVGGGEEREEACGG